MFKLVLLCAFFAVAAAKPDLLISAPITEYSTYLSPASTTITKQESSVIHPSPLLYQAPLAYTHFIKKRSPQFSVAYTAPAAYSYYPNYIAASTYSAPLLHSAPILSAAAPIASVPAVHLIKKRAAPVFPTTFYAPSTNHSTPISHPLIHSLPAQPIKKRSAEPLLYIAPTSYQSRYDIKTSNIPWTSISYAAPFAYSSPIAYSTPFAHLYK